MPHYKETRLSENVFIREFESQVDYPWHRDKEDRKVEVLSCGENWYFQLDNCLPFKLEKGRQISISKQEFHRLISGNETLVVKVTKIV